VAGSIVGLVDEGDLLPRLDAMGPGDVLIGLPSSGLHTNGYSLARKVCFDVEQLKVSDTFPGTDRTVAEVLLAVHRSYLPQVMPLVKAHRLLAMAHITGGGLTDNLPRVLPKHLDALIDTASWEVPILFRFLAEKAQLPSEDARRSFNLGVGMVLVTSQGNAEQVLAELKACGEPAWVLGELTRGEGKVRYR
jgi:phosphoribosylformylglycinamidine cyclo-ligase